MKIQSVSIIIPCYNEEQSLPELLKRVLQADCLGLRRDVIVVDDGSSDRSAEIISEVAAKESAVRLESHEVNRGKGAALRTGFDQAKGDIVLIQDSDLEYDPAEYPALLGPLVQGEADVVFGSRFRGGQPLRLIYYWNGVANRILTNLSNFFTNVNFSDMECGYKVFRREVLERIRLSENRFGIEPEITAKICRLRPRIRICEVGIRYWGRTYEEGKKIGFRDGCRAIYCILRYNLFPQNPT